MTNDPAIKLPDEVAAIQRCGYVVFTDESLPAEFRGRFDTERIPVTAVRHVRQWGLQVDDEFELPGRTNQYSRRRAMGSQHSRA